MKRFVLAGGCLWALACSVLAAPPSLEIPAEVRPVQGYVRVAPKTDAVSVTYVALDGLFPFPSEELKDARRFVLPVAGVKAGRYRYVAVGASATGEQTAVEFAAVVGDGGDDKKRDDDKKKDDPSPSPPTPVAEKVFVVVVEDAQAARTVETAKALNDPWWATLKLKHDYRFYQSDARTAMANGYTAEAEKVGYPAALVLDQKDGTVLKRLKFTGVEPVKAAVKEVSK